MEPNAQTEGAQSSALRAKVQSSGNKHGNGKASIAKVAPKAPGLLSKPINKPSGERSASMICAIHHKSTTHFLALGPPLRQPEPILAGVLAFFFVLIFNPQCW